MRIRNKIIIAAFAAGMSAVAAPAAAQQAAAPAGAPAAAQKAAIAPGTAVKDTAGGAVGTIARVDGDHVVVKTDRHEVRLPTSSFTPVEGGLLFGMTQAQLNAEVDKAKAAAGAKIAVGAAVTGAAGANVGTIAAVDAEWVTLKLTSGASVRLPRSAVAAGDKGVVTSVTAAELEAAAKGGDAPAEAEAE
jgi:preprotein translocase subunit YajC